MEDAHNARARNPVILPSKFIGKTTKKTAPPLKRAPLIKAASQHLIHLSLLFRADGQTSVKFLVVFFAVVRVSNAFISGRSLCP